MKIFKSHIGYIAKSTTLYYWTAFVIGMGFYIMKEIKLTRGYVALVDDEDYERVSKFKWFAAKSHSVIYAQRRKKKQNGKQFIISLHRFILNIPDFEESGLVVDHLNHDGLDNQKHNLRPCTNHQNLMNKRSVKNSSSKYKGVCWVKQNSKWISQIRHNTKLIYLGKYKSETDAAQAYNIKAIELFGEFACLNVI